MKKAGKPRFNIEPGAGFMVIYAPKHGQTAIDGEGGASFAVS